MDACCVLFGLVPAQEWVFVFALYVPEIVIVPNWESFGRALGLARPMDKLTDGLTLIDPSIENETTFINAPGLPLGIKTSFDATDKLTLLAMIS